MEDLTTLHMIRQEGERLDYVKEELMNILNQSEQVSAALSDLRAEKAVLQREKNEYIGLMRAVQQDLDSIGQLEESLRRQQEELVMSEKTMRTEQLDPLKDTLDTMRQAQGLPRLTTLEQDMVERQHSYMEARMQDWNNAGITPHSSSSMSKRQKKR